MRTWLAQREPRERRLLAFAAMAILGAALWVGALEPLHEAVRRAEITLAGARELDAWLAARLPAAAPAGPRAGRATPQALVTAVGATAAVRGLEPALRRVIPTGGGVRVAIDGLPFEALAAWLVDLEEAHGVRVERIAIERTGQPGQVRATITLGAAP